LTREGQILAFGYLNLENGEGRLMQESS
jgi:hypothetical protein